MLPIVFGVVTFRIRWCPRCSRAQLQSDMHTYNAAIDMREQGQRSEAVSGLLGEVR